MQPNDSYLQWWCAIVCYSQMLGCWVLSRQNKARMWALIGTPVWSCLWKNCRAVKNVVLQSRQINLHQIADTMGISTGSVTTIMHKNLLMTKVMFDQKMNDCQCVHCENLKHMQLNWNSFMWDIVTGDETWIHYYDYDPETKQLSMQWKHFGFLKSP